MPNYNDRDLADALSLVDAFLTGRWDVNTEPAHLAVADIEMEAGEFSDDLDFLKTIKAPALALRIGKETLVPVALSLLVGDRWPKLARPGGPPRWWYREMIYDYFVSSSGKTERWNVFESISVEEAETSFRRLASSFLATRIAAVREFGADVGNATLRMLKRAGSPHRVSTPGCKFTVSTNTSGLRVFWSGAYRISSNYFGSPTTPTASVLQSGTYVFGVDGGAYGSTIQWDRSAVVALPGTPTVHLNY